MAPKPLQDVARAYTAVLAQPVQIERRFDELGILALGRNATQNVRCDVAYVSRLPAKQVTNVREQRFGVQVGRVGGLEGFLPRLAGSRARVRAGGGAAGAGAGAGGTLASFVCARRKQRSHVATRGVQHMRDERTRRVLDAAVATRQQEGRRGEKLPRVAGESALVRGLGTYAGEKLEAVTLLFKTF